MAGRLKTKMEEMSESEMLDMLQRDKRNMENLLLRVEHIPEGWWGIEGKFSPSREKDRITIRLDSEIVEFFRAHGHGYQGKINEVLRTYMKARLAKVLTRPEETDAYGDLI